MDSRYKRIEVNTEVKVNDIGIFYGLGWDDAFPSVPLVTSYEDFIPDLVVSKPRVYKWNGMSKILLICDVKGSYNSGSMHGNFIQVAPGLPRA